MRLGIGARKWIEPVRRPVRIALLCMACATLSEHTFAATLTRGPYLQSTSTTSVTVVWKTRPAATTTLEYGTTLGYGTAVSSGPDTIHAVTLANLAPATRYYYRVREGLVLLASGKEHYFETAPTSGGLRAALFGDSGKGSTTQMDMARRIREQRIDLLIHLGDIVYDAGEEKYYDSRFFKPYDGLLRHTPVFTTLGNHDVATQSGAPYFANFYLPTANSFDGSEKHYSFDWGDTHFVTVNSNALTSSVASWLATDLAASTKRWKVVFFHHATYSCGYHGTNSGVLSLIVPVLEAQNVDIVFAGHEHDYQRTFPIRAGTTRLQGNDRDYVNPEGPLYVITGGGAGVRATANTCWFTNVALSVPHVTRFQIAGDLLYLDAVDSTGTRIDAMSIRKTNDPTIPYVQILSGNGGEHWTVGSTAAFTWMSGGVGSTVDVQLSRNGGASYETLAAGIADTGAFSWTVTGPPAAACALRIVATAAAGSASVLDASDAAFVIDPASMPAAPIAVAASSATTGEGNLDVTFSGSNLAPDAAIVAQGWRFGDGAAASGATAAHTYTSAGTFTARYDILDANGLAGSDSVSVTVWQAAPPVVALDADKFSGRAPLDVSFTAQVSDASSLAAQTWSFGDGNQASGATPSHTFTVAGTYVVRFTATDAIGLSSADSLTVTVDPPAADTEAPRLATRSPAPNGTGIAPSAPLVVSLVDLGTGVDAASVQLRVNDVLVSHTPSGAADSLVVSYATKFTSGATISVALQAADRAASPNVVSWSWSFQVASAPAVEVAYNYQPASFAVPSGYVMDRGAAFTTAAGFGWDKSVSTEARVTSLEPHLNSYVYVTNTSAATWQMALAEGDYLVSLIVGSPAYTGLHRVDIEGVRVVHDVATSDRQFYTVTDHPVHVADGYLTVRVGGITGSTKKTKLCTLSIRSTSNGEAPPPPLPPTAAATATPQTGEAPLPVSFTGASTGSLATSTWTFGDGASDTGANTTHTYAAAGTYIARFVVTDLLDRSARDSVAVVVSTGAPPVLALTASPDSGTSPLEVSFVASIQDLSSIASKTWKFGDGQSTSNASVVHTYAAAGDYWARFEATDARGHTARDSVRIQVATPAAPAADTSPPRLATRAPGAGASGIDVATTLVVSLADAGSGVDATSVVLRIDSNVVQPAISGTPDSLVLRYAPSPGFPAGTTVPVQLTAADRATPANSASWNWSFTTAAATSSSLQVNFQPSAFPVPSGYVSDNGRPYDAVRGYGWDKNLSTESRTSSADALRNSYVYISNPSAAVWQVPVQNGSYRVSLVVGSPAFTGLHRVEVEGVLVVNNVATGSGQFHSVTDHFATVSDGFLSVRIGGITGTSKKTKLCYLTVGGGSSGDSSGTRSGDDPPGDDPPSNTPPTVVATAEPATGNAPLVVAFSASTSDPEGDPVTIAWDFGDGGVGSGATATHAYASPGTYHAVVTATDSGNGAARDTVVVVVGTATSPGGAAQRINFQPANDPVPEGYAMDCGRTYDTALGYGWDQNIKSETRSYADPRLAGYVYVSNTSTATWSLAVPDGIYLVTLVAGSPAFTGLHRVAVEEVVVIDGVSTSSGGFVTVSDVPVRVSDGALSVRIGGIPGNTKKTKLCYVHVSPASTKPDARQPLPQSASLAVEPNPFRSSVTLRFRTPVATRLLLEIFDVRGRRVRQLFDGTVPASVLHLGWDGRTDGGEKAARGVYYARASLPARRFTTKLVLLE